MARAPKDGPTGREAIEEIDRRLGGLLGPFAEGLAKIVEAAEKAQDAAGAREVTIDGAKGPVKVRAGYSVRVGGLAGSERAEAAAEAEAGRDPAEPVSEPEAPAAQEPVVDVFEDAAGWTLTADMPGVGEADLSVSAGGGRVTVETTGARRYRVETEAPAWVTASALERRLTNGVLELFAAKPGDPA